MDWTWHTKRGIFAKAECLNLQTNVLTTIIGCWFYLLNWAFPLRSGCRCRAFLKVMKREREIQILNCYRMLISDTLTQMISGI